MSKTRQTTENLANAAKALAKQGPMSTLAIITALSPDKRVAVLDAHTSRLMSASKKLPAIFSSMISELEHNLSELGKSKATQGLQQNYAQQLTPLKADAIMWREKTDNLTKQLRQFADVELNSLASKLKKLSSPSEIKTELASARMKFQVIAKEANHIEINTDALIKKLRPLQTEVHNAAVNNSLPVAPQASAKPE